MINGIFWWKKIKQLTKNVQELILKKLHSRGIEGWHIQHKTLTFDVS